MQRMTSIFSVGMPLAAILTTFAPLLDDADLFGVMPQQHVTKGFFPVLVIHRVEKFGLTNYLTCRHSLAQTHLVPQYLHTKPVSSHLIRHCRNILTAYMYHFLPAHVQALADHALAPLARLGYYASVDCPSLADTKVCTAEGHLHKAKSLHTTHSARANTPMLLLQCRHALHRHLLRAVCFVGRNQKWRCTVCGRTFHHMASCQPGNSQ